jgi:hypothetical protein
VSEAAIVEQEFIDAASALLDAIQAHRFHMSTDPCHGKLTRCIGVEVAEAREARWRMQQWRRSA